MLYIGITVPSSNSISNWTKSC